MSVTEAAGTAAKLPLTFACGLYDRMLRLYTGEVQPRGIDSRRSWCRAGRPHVCPRGLSASECQPCD